MNASSLIFVALLAAWGVYLVPKLREQQAPTASSGRMGEAFSKTVRVLARRDAVAGAQRLITDATDYLKPATVTPIAAARKPLSPAVRREIARRAARRRRRVLIALTLLLIIIGGLAEWHVLPLWSLISPVALIAAWLFACRRMVLKERPVSILRPVNAETDPEAVSVTSQVELALEEDGAPVEAITPDPTGSWTPVAVPLPGYVDQPVAPRSVRTIDLDGTGVWSAGHNEADSALAREAEVVRQQIVERHQQRKTS